MAYKKNYPNNRRKTQYHNAPSSSQKLEPVEINYSPVITPTLQLPSINVDTIFGLADYIDNSQNTPSFPEISIIPNVLRNLGKFVNERTRMRHAHEEFEKKLAFVSDYADKQLQLSFAHLQNETELQLAQINGNTRVQMQKINRHYETEMKKCESAYRFALAKLRSDTELQLTEINNRTHTQITEINRHFDLETQKVRAECQLRLKQIDSHYRNLEQERRERARRFNRMMDFATIKLGESQKAVAELTAVTQFLSRKICSNQASDAEISYYTNLMYLRLNECNSVSIITELAAQIK